MCFLNSINFYGFGDEAVATLIGVIVGSVISVPSTWITLNSVRKRKKHIFCTELFRQRLVHTQEVLGNIQYNGRNLTSVSLSKVQIINNTSQVIEEPEITISLEGNVSILSATSLPIVPEERLTVSEKQIILKPEYMNTYDDHDEKYVVTIIYENNIDKLNFSGRGQGWTIKQQPTMTKLQKILTIQAFILIALDPFIWGYFLLTALMQINIDLPTNTLFRSVLFVAATYSIILKPLMLYSEIRNLKKHSYSFEEIAILKYQPPNPL